MIYLKCIVIVFSNFEQYLLNVRRKMFYDIINCFFRDPMTLMVRVYTDIGYI